MKCLVLCLCVGCFIGCSSTQKTADISAPRLLIHQPLPLLPESINKPPSLLDLSMLIGENGSVIEVQLLSSSGSASWDSLATATMRQWRFVPAREKDKPISTWLRLQASVQYETPHYVSLVEMLCTTQEEADTAYNALEQGRDFGDLVMQYSTAPSRNKKGALGEIDINCYPENIRRILGQLRVDKYTRPIKFGDKYIIFMRAW